MRVRAFFYIIITPPTKFFAITLPPSHRPPRPPRGGDRSSIRAVAFCSYLECVYSSGVNRRAYRPYIRHVVLFLCKGLGTRPLSYHSLLYLRPYRRFVNSLCTSSLHELRGVYGRIHRYVVHSRKWSSC